MARSPITAKNGKIVFQCIEYTVAEWLEKKRAEEWVDSRQEELAQKKRLTMAKQRITFRLMLWVLIAIVAAPFAAVLLFSFWLQDIVAGANKHKWRKKL